jgi:hypothetical protein
MSERRAHAPHPRALVRHQLELLAEARNCDDEAERATIYAQLRQGDALVAKQEAAGDQLAQLPDVWQHIYGDGPGFLSLFSGSRGPHGLTEPRAAYFAWTGELPAALRWVEREAAEERELYQCAHLLTKWRRRKDDAAPLASLYVDLDHGTLAGTAVVAPSLVVQSSPGRLQCYWHLTEPVRPEVGEAVNRRLVQAVGADKTGWDLTQLLRVPGTRNFKYDDQPLVKVLSATGQRYELAQMTDRLADLPLFAPQRRPPVRAEFRPADNPERDSMPVPLTGYAKRIWQGEAVRYTPDGRLDRSASLLRIARVLHGAHLSRSAIVAALAERDVTLGWRKYSERADAQAQYEHIAAYIEAQR